MQRKDFFPRSIVDELLSIQPPFVEISCCPRECTVAPLLGLILSFVFPLALYFLSHQFEQPLMFALCYWFHHLSYPPLAEWIMFRCYHRMACHVSSPSTAHFCVVLTLRGEFYMVHAEPSHSRGAPEVPVPLTLGAQYITR